MKTCIQNVYYFQDHFDDWRERLEGLEKGDKHYYCDICVPKKQVKGATEEGAMKSVICHLAIQHHELREKLEKDSSLNKEFIQEIYYDVDLKKVQEELKDLGIQPVEKPSEAAEKPKEDTNEETKEEAPKSPVKKSKPGPASKKTTPGPASKKTVETPPPSKPKPGPASSKKPKVGPKSKTQTVDTPPPSKPKPGPASAKKSGARPGPKSRTKRKAESDNDDDSDDMPDFNSDNSGSEKKDRSALKRQSRGKKPVSYNYDKDDSE